MREEILFIHGPSWVAGERRNLAELPALTTDSALLATMRRNGLSYYRQASGSAAELAKEATLKTLSGLGLAGGDVDAVIYATSSFDTRAALTVDYARFAADVGMAEKPTFGTFLNDCANIASALQLASGLLSLGAYRRLLLVTTDVFPSDDARLRNRLLTVNSDGAAACVLSREPSAIGLLALRHVWNQHAWLGGDIEKRFLGTLKGVQSAATALLQELQASGEDFAALLANNYHKSCLNMFAFQCGVPPERVVHGDLAGYGHLSSSDCLMNLGAYAAERAGSSDLVMSVTTGIASSAAMAFHVKGRSRAS